MTEDTSNQPAAAIVPPKEAAVPLTDVVPVQGLPKETPAPPGTAALKPRAKNHPHHQKTHPHPQKSVLQWCLELNVHALEEMDLVDIDRRMQGKCLPSGTIMGMMQRESVCDPEAESYTKDIGLCQISHDNIQKFIADPEPLNRILKIIDPNAPTLERHAKVPIHRFNPKDPRQSLAAGYLIMAQNYCRYNGDIEKTVASYNCWNGGVYGKDWKSKVPSTTLAYVNDIVPKIKICGVLQESLYRHSRDGKLTFDPTDRTLMQAMNERLKQLGYQDHAAKSGLQAFEETMHKRHIKSPSGLELAKDGRLSLAVCELLTCDLHGEDATLRAVQSPSHGLPHKHTPKHVTRST